MSILFSTFAIQNKTKNIINLGRGNGRAEHKDYDKRNFYKGIRDHLQQHQTRNKRRTVHELLVRDNRRAMWRLYLIYKT